MNLRSHGPEPCASANSAISACIMSRKILHGTTLDRGGLITSCSTEMLISNAKLIYTLT